VFDVVQILVVMLAQGLTKYPPVLLVAKSSACHGSNIFGMPSNVRLTLLDSGLMTEFGSVKV
jgi:hypothetical protein